MVSEDVREEYKRRLLSKREILKNNLSSLCVPQQEDERREVGNYEPDPWIFNNACFIVLQRSISQIDRALDILKNDPQRYGICEKCCQHIPAERLEIMPQATACAVCPNYI
ncbi:MAG: hypothetical protein HYW69_01505 [Candidatus Nealsonbacteria bacterium]|nr:hypothetical protein [Candidatus Nealsonbacteria bacterium]